MAATRFPRRVSTRASVVTKSISTVRFSRPSAAVPKSTEGLRSSRNQHVSSRSSWKSRTWVTSVRAVTFQSIARMSSPGWYSRRFARSIPVPRNSVPYSPWSRPSRRRTTVQSRRWTTRSGAGGNGGMVAERDGRRGDALEDRREDPVGRDVVRQRLVREDEPVAHDVGRHVEHVLGEDIPPAADEGERLARQDQVDRGAGAGAVRDVARQLGHPEAAGDAGRDGQPHRVVV